MPEFRPDLDYIREIWPTLSDAERREFYRQYQSEASPAQARADISKFPAAALDVLLLAPRGVAGAAIDATSAIGRAGQYAGKALGVVPGEAEPVNIPNPYRSMTPFYDEVRRAEAKYPMADVPFDKFTASFLPGGRYSDQPIPPPPPPAPPVKEEGEDEAGGKAAPAAGRAGTIPSGAAGLPPLKLREIGFLQDPAARQAAVEKGVAERMGELGQYKSPEKTFLDSPYSALVQAGLGMLMGGAGKSPLEAIAMGGQRGFEAAKEIAQRQESRAEREYNRKVQQIQLRASLEKEMSDLSFKTEELNAKFLHLENERQKGMDDAAYKRAHLALEGQANQIRNRANELMELRINATERGQTITSLTQELNRLLQVRKDAMMSPNPERELAGIDRQINAIRARLGMEQGMDQRGSAPPPPKSVLGTPR
jgi:hypothetical protein